MSELYGKIDCTWKYAFLTPIFMVLAGCVETAPQFTFNDFNFGISEYNTASPKKKEEIIKKLTAELGHGDCFSAAKALGEIGPEAKSATPELISALHNYECKEAAVATLAAMGDSVIPELFKSLVYPYNPHNSNENTVVRVILELAPRFPNSVPVLISLLSYPDSEIRKWAVNDLGEIGPDAKSATPKLIEVLNDPDGLVCSSAATALKNIGPAAKDAIPHLVKIAGDSSRRFCPDSAAEALKSLGTAGIVALDMVNKNKARNQKQIDQKNQIYVNKNRALACSLIDGILANPSDQTRVAALNAIVMNKNFPKYWPSWMDPAPGCFDIGVYGSLGCTLGTYSRYFKCADVGR